MNRSFEDSIETDEKLVSVSIVRNGKEVGKVEFSISILKDGTVFATLDKSSEIETTRYSTRLRVDK